MPAERQVALASIVADWEDAWRRPRTLDQRTRDAVLGAMRVEAGRQLPDVDPVRVARPGERLAPVGEVTLEDGTALGRRSRLPADTPIGYHRLRTDTGEQLLLVPPRRCTPPPSARSWGWAVQLATLRSRVSWGIGDLGDLRRFAAWSAQVGCGAIVASPLGAPAPGRDPEPSPYFPSSRRFLSPLVLDVDAVPAASAGPAVAALRSRGTALLADRRIRHSVVGHLKLRALEEMWSAARDTAETRRLLAAYREERGASLEAWATFVVLAEHFGDDWRRWPEPFRTPRSPAVDRFAREQPDRVAFHAWVQALLDRQLGEAGGVGPRLVADLPVGFDPAGFDAWDWQELLADGASIGAPPDVFNPAGQDWALPPFVPHRLRAAGLAPFVETVRAALRHAGGLRIDHVLGFFRQWWVPEGDDPASGAYVRYPADELLALVAIESVRSGAFVIGEDLGTVGRDVRRALRRHGLLSVRLAYFERRPPAAYPRLSVAALTTHDLPTAAGTWCRSDTADLRRAGIDADPRPLERLRNRMARVAGVEGDASLEEAVLGVYAALAASPASLVVAPVEDALRVEERPNVPGTTEERRPNWSVALPRSIEAISRDGFTRRLVAALRR